MPQIFFRWKLRLLRVISPPHCDFMYIDSHAWFQDVRDKVFFGFKSILGPFNLSLANILLRKD